MSVLYVFDIDGTLLRADGAGGRAFDRALALEFDLAGGGEGVRFGGKTDPQILDEILVLRRGRVATADERAQFLATYLRELEPELARSAGFHVLPGVGDALDYLDAQPATLGLGTGNVEAGAVAKLRRAALHGRFAFG
ncbi:HAD family hydrolase, partial [Stenotrophomonas maltophilia]|uniref:HAD family hydrolase n=1 Tax=Stenotrophomonas maltophilia TaxID=40324 RepID=UPI003BF8FD3B